MEKRRFLVLFTFIGVLAIIGISVSLKYSKAVLANEEDYIKANLKEEAKKCIEDVKCNKGTLTVKELINKAYIQGDLKERCMNYSLDSYISYPDYEVHLFK